MNIIIVVTIYISNDKLAELTENTVRSIKTSFDHEVILVNNYCAPQYLERMKALGKIIQNKTNQLASAFNIALNYGVDREVDYIIVLNNDVVLKHDAIDNLISFAQVHPEISIFGAHPIYSEKEDIENTQIKESPYDGVCYSCFMLSPKTVEALKKVEMGTKEPYPGYFDENFGVSYFEDTDYGQRIARAGMQALVTQKALFWHYGSATIKMDKERQTLLPAQYERNREYYKRKWGFDIHHQHIAHSDPIRFKYKGPFEP